MRILIVKLSSIGDVVHTLPALAMVRRALPEAEISWAVERGAAEILRGNPFLHRLIEVDTRSLRREKTATGKVRLARRQFADLRVDKFDVALDFQGLLKSALIARLSGAPRRAGFAKNALREPASRFLLTETVEVPERINVIEKNRQLAARVLSIEPPPEVEFPIALEPSHEREAADIIERAGENFVVLNPGGGWTTKLWSARRFGNLADALWEQFKLKSVVMENPGETHLAESVLAASQTHQITAAQTSLKGFYALARRAKLYVGGDTGLTHLAAAANAPVVGIFGPTEWWRNGSPHSADVAVERLDIDCRENCHRRACDKWICMDISVAGVLAAAARRLNDER